MKAYALAVGFIGACLCFGLFTFWRIHVVEEEGFQNLSSQTEDITRKWEADRVPIKDRIITFVFPDKRFDDDLFTPPAPPSWAKKPVAQLNLALLPRKNKKADPAKLGRIFTEPAVTSARLGVQTSTATTVVWEYDSFLNEENSHRLPEAIAAALKIVQAAGGQSNIVAQGIAATATIAALKSLESLQVPGARPLVNKLVCLGRNPSRGVAGVPRAFAVFKQPSNLSQMITVSRDSDETQLIKKDLMVELYTSSLSGRSAPAYLIAPASSAKPEVDAQALAGVVKEVIERPEGAEEVVSEKEQAAKEKTRVWKNHDGFYFTKDSPPSSLPTYAAPVNSPTAPTAPLSAEAAPPQQPPQDSFSFIRGGQDYADPQARNSGSGAGGSSPGNSGTGGSGATGNTASSPQTGATHVMTSAELAGQVDGSRGLGSHAVRQNAGPAPVTSQKTSPAKSRSENKTDPNCAYWMGVDKEKYGTQRECHDHTRSCSCYGW